MKESVDYAFIPLKQALRDGLRTQGVPKKVARLRIDVRKGSLTLTLSPKGGEGTI